MERIIQTKRIIYVTIFLVLFNVFDVFSQPSQTLLREQTVLGKKYLGSNKAGNLQKLIAVMEKEVTPEMSLLYSKMNYLKGGYYYYETDNYLDALELLEETIASLEKDTSLTNILVDALIISGHCKGQLDKDAEALDYYQKAQKIEESNPQKMPSTLANIHYFKGITYQEKKRLIQSNKSLLEGLAILDSTYNPASADYLKFYKELSTNYNKIGNHDLNIKYAKKYVEIKSKDTSIKKTEIIKEYLSLGKVYRTIDDCNTAISYYKKALQIAQDVVPRDIQQEANLLYYIGDAYHLLKQYEDAYSFLEQAKSTNPKDHFFEYEIYRRKGQQESFANNHDIAWEYFQKALNGLKANKNSFDYDILLCYMSIIDHLVLEAKQYNDALLYIEQAETVGGYRSYFQFYFSMAKGICYANLENFKQSTSFFEKAKISINGQLPKEKVDLHSLSNRVYLKYWMAEAFFRQAKKENNAKLMHQANDLLSENIDLVNYIISKYQGKSAKEKLMTNYYEVFEKAIEVKYQLYELTKHTAYLSEAFTISEQSKNLTLFEVINTNKAFASSGIPSSIKEEEYRLKSNITYLENLKFEENEQSSKNEKFIAQIDNNIFELKQTYGNLLSTIETDFPRYQQLRFNPSNISIREIQASVLEEDQALVEYTSTDTILYVYLIKKDTFQVFKLLQKRDNLKSKIDSFRQSIYSYRPSYDAETASKNDSLKQLATTLGKELYRNLIQPIENNLTQKITIVTSGSLGYLPFDALIKASSEKENRASEHYLIEDYLISYAYSAQWLNELYEPTESEFAQNFIGVAPEFQVIEEGQAIADFRLGLGPLQHNQAEVEIIKTDIGGKIITGAAATRQAFLAYLSQGQILHLATHGKSNDEQGDYSYLAFAKPRDTTDNQFLYVKDLFNLKIPAELVVLSACETGLGEIKRGEGIVGIGKGFSYAGAKSMVTTLWRVSDNSTANFMPLFYKNLKSGQAKDEALWNAKKEFIKTYRTAGHPFFWSGYVAYGNMQPIDFQHINWSISSVFGGVIIGLLLLFLLRYIFTNY